MVMSDFFFFSKNHFRPYPLLFFSLEWIRLGVCVQSPAVICQSLRYSNTEWSLAFFLLCSAAFHKRLSQLCWPGQTSYHSQGLLSLLKDFWVLASDLTNWCTLLKSISQKMPWGSLSMLLHLWKPVLFYCCYNMLAKLLFTRLLWKN